MELEMKKTHHEWEDKDSNMSAFADKAKQKIAEDNQFAATLLNALDS